MFPHDAVERPILSPYGRLLMWWRRIDLHMQFHYCPVECQECSQQPVEAVSADQFSMRGCSSHGVW